MKDYNERDKTVSYEMLLNYFGEEVIHDRVKFVYEKMSQYLAERKLSAKIVIDNDILHQAILDYFADIYRIKVFHGIDRVNLNKIDGYEIYWLLRRKPMQVIDKQENRNLVFVNEGFLTVFIAHECLSPNESVTRTEDQEKALLGYLDHIFYSLKYRKVDQQWLETILYSIDVGKLLGNP